MPMRTNLRDIQDMKMRPSPLRDGSGQPTQIVSSLDATRNNRKVKHYMRIITMTLDLTNKLFSNKMNSFHRVLLWATVVACNVLALEFRLAQAATVSNFLCISYNESLPPLSVESFTNRVRLRFTGNPAQRFALQRAPALSGPWTTLATRTAPTPLLFNTTTPTGLRPAPSIVWHTRRERK